MFHIDDQAADKRRHVGTHTTLLPSQTNSEMLCHLSPIRRRCPWCGWNCCPSKHLVSTTLEEVRYAPT
jgi:hypothetical protein